MPRNPNLPPRSGVELEEDSYASVLRLRRQRSGIVTVLLVLLLAIAAVWFFIRVRPGLLRPTPATEDTTETTPQIFIPGVDYQPALDDDSE